MEWAIKASKAYNDIGTKNIERGMNTFITLEEETENAKQEYEINGQVKEKEDEIQEVTPDMLEDIKNETNGRQTIGDTDISSDELENER